jgi:hypothetical protein
MSLNLLFDATSFRLTSGNPEGLLATVEREAGRRVVRPSNWFGRVSREGFREPVILPPLPVTEESAGTLEQDRLMRLAWMAEWLLPFFGDYATLSDHLGSAYRVLQAILRGSTYEHMVVPDPGGGFQGILARFVWLSLPLPDRERISFHGDVRSLDLVTETINVLQDGHRPKSIPPNWILFEPASYVPPGSVPENLQRYARAVCALGQTPDDGVKDLVLPSASLFEDQRSRAWFDAPPAQPSAPGPQTLSSAFFEFTLEGSSGSRLSERRVADLARSIEYGARAEFGNFTPEEASGRILSPYADLAVPQELKDRCAAVFLENLASSERPWDRELAVLLGSGWVSSPSGPDVLGWFSKALAETPDLFESIVSRPPSVSRAFQATRTAVLASAISLPEVKDGILPVLFRSPPPIPENLISGIQVPQTREDLEWAVTVLDKAISNAPRDLVLEKFLGVCLEAPAEAVTEEIGKENRLLSLAVEYASHPDLLALLERVRPDFQRLWGSFEVRMWEAEEAEDGDAWAELLQRAGWDLEVPSVTEFDVGELMPRILASETWTDRNERAYRALADWMGQSLDSPSLFVPTAHHVIETRCNAGKVLPLAEVRLVAAAVRILGAARCLERSVGSRLAESAVESRGAPLAWSDAWRSGEEVVGRTSPGVFGEFAEAAAVQVRKWKTKGEALDEALMVAWMDHEMTGNHTFVEAVLPRGDLDTQKRIVELLERQPPPPLYRAIRERARTLAPYRQAGESEQRALRARMTKVAPGLSPFFGGSTPRDLDPWWARWMPWKKRTHSRSEARRPS